MTNEPGDPGPAGERERVLDLVRRHGWNSTAFQTLEHGYSYFFHGDACVAYVETARARARVVAGAPIAASDVITATTRAFVDDTVAAGKRCSFVATEERFVAATAEFLRAVPIGEQPVWDPRTWPERLKSRKSLREQLRRARAKGVKIRELAAAELASGPTREAIAGIAQRWLDGRDMAPMEFLVRMEPFTVPSDRRCFVAERDGAIVGFAAVIPVPARGGWFIEDLVREPDAPNGTIESLVDAVMRWAAEAGCEWLTLGLAPLAGDVSGLLRFARRRTSFFYDFEGLHAFKAKLGPNDWAPIHLSFPPHQGVLRSFADVLVAFSGGGLLRFVVRSLLRGPKAVIRLFALLLVPWTVLLAIAPAEPWFGAVWAKWAWVAFDVLLVAGLFRALRRPTRAVFTALAVAVTADAVLTLVHAVLWHGGRAHDALGLAMIALACTGPVAAAILLWGATRRIADRLRATRPQARAGTRAP